MEAEARKTTSGFDKTNYLIDLNYDAEVMRERGLVATTAKYYLAPTIWQSCYDRNVWFASLELVRREGCEVVFKVEGKGPSPAHAIIQAENNYKEIKNA